MGWCVSEVGGGDHFDRACAKYLSVWPETVGRGAFGLCVEVCRQFLSFIVKRIVAPSHVCRHLPTEYRSLGVRAFNKIRLGSCVMLCPSGSTASVPFFLSFFLTLVVKTSGASHDGHSTFLGFLFLVKLTFVNIG